MSTTAAVFACAVVVSLLALLAGAQTLLWELPLNIQPLTEPVFTTDGSGIVIAGVTPNNQLNVFCVNISSGAPLWIKLFPASSSSPENPPLDSRLRVVGSVVVVSTFKFLYALSALSGDQLWNISEPSPYQQYLFVSFDACGDLVVVLHQSSTTNVLQWEIYDLKTGYQTFAPLVVHALSGSQVAGGVIVIDPICATAVFTTIVPAQAIRLATGTLKWTSYDMDQYANPAATNTVLCVRGAGYMLSTGERLWTSSVSLRTLTSAYTPVIAGGVLVTLTSDASSVVWQAPETGAVLSVMEYAAPVASPLASPFGVQRSTGAVLVHTISYISVLKSANTTYGFATDMNLNFTTPLPLAANQNVLVGIADGSVLVAMQIEA